MDLTLRLHDWLARSRANGPGLRAVLWVQGCTLGCPGCFNPGTHPRAGGTERPVAEVLDWLAGLATSRRDPITGLSVSGGEPLQQAPAVLAVCEGAQALGLTVLLWTGYSWPEVDRMPFRARLLRAVDVLIAGRYDPTQRLARDLRGSANKTVVLGARGRLTPRALGAVPRAEACIAGETVLWTGMEGIR